MNQPIVCELTPDTVRARRNGLLPSLAERAIRREETADGYVLTFAASSETLHAIATVIDAERQCCRWLRFAVGIEPDGGPVTLTLSGPPGAREFLSELLNV